jgi:signal transduction histidine kinase
VLRKAFTVFEELRMRGRRRLAEALQDELAGWSERTGIRVETWALPQGPVPPRIADAVLAAVAEALSNVERHSGASTVSIAVTVAPSGLRMTVSDDGRGFSGFAAGRGIRAMRARFAEVGGSLRVTSVPGEGTTVSGVVPRPRGPR